MKREREKTCAVENSAAKKVSLPLQEIFLVGKNGQLERPLFDNVCSGMFSAKATIVVLVGREEGERREPTRVNSPTDY